ncbi:33016_t:CDS:2, partial [Gigaspora margarita]
PRNSKALLVFDSFLAHIIDLIKAALRLENTNLAIIPGALLDISEDVIIRTFKKYGISNCLLKSEDHLIYNNDNENNSNENSDNNESEVEEEGSDKELDENKESDENNETGDENKEFNKNDKTGDEMDK